MVAGKLEECKGPEFPRLVKRVSGQRSLSGNVIETCFRTDGPNPIRALDNGTNGWNIGNSLQASRRMNRQPYPIDGLGIGVIDMGPIICRKGSIAIHDLVRRRSQESGTA